MPYFKWPDRFLQEVAAPPPSNFLVVPTDSRPNQTFTTKLAIDGVNINLELALRFNEMAGYWVLTITDPESGTILLDSIPLITGVQPASNILGQFEYLGIGSAYVVPVGGSSLDYPDSTTLGTAFQLVWGDTPQ